MTKYPQWVKNHFDRYGVYPIAGGKGGTTTTIVSEPKSATQLAVEERQLEVLDLQLIELQRQNEALAEVFPEQKELLALQISSTTALLSQLEETPLQTQIRETAEANTLAFLKGEAPPISEGRAALIEQQFGAAEEQVSTDLERFAGELAASRGLQVTDSPILAEILRQKQQASTALRGAEAQAKLGGGFAEEQAGFAIQQFQENLRLAAAENRALITGRTSQLLPFSRSGAPNVAPILSVLEQGRGRTQRTSGGGGGALDIFSAIAGPAATVGAAAIIASTAKVKKNILPLNLDEYDAALQRVKDTPIVRYRYKWETDQGEPHIGPILELSPPEISDDGVTVNMLDYAGLQHAALKAVDRKVERLKLAIKNVT